MKAKFIEGEGTDLALQFEPETTDEMLLLKIFTERASVDGYRFTFDGWSYNESGRPIFNEKSTLTSVRGRIVKQTVQK